MDRFLSLLSSSAALLTTNSLSETTRTTLHGVSQAPHALTQQRHATRRNSYPALVQNAVATNSSISSPQSLTGKRRNSFPEDSIIQKTRVKRRRRRSTVILRSYEAARKFVRTQGIRTQAQWYAWSKRGCRPNDIPSNPHIHYAKQWDSWGSFLGTSNIRRTRIKFRDFRSARRYASTLGLKTHKEWRVWSKSGRRPRDIPANPQSKYLYSGWEGWKHFLTPYDVEKEEEEFRRAQEKKTRNMATTPGEQEATKTISNHQHYQGDDVHKNGMVTVKSSFIRSHSSPNSLSHTRTTSLPSQETLKTWVSHHNQYIRDGPKLFDHQGQAFALI